MSKLRDILEFIQTTDMQIIERDERSFVARKDDMIIEVQRHSFSDYDVEVYDFDCYVKENQHHMAESKDLYIKNEIARATRLLTRGKVYE